MNLGIPGARRVELERLLSVLGIPFAAALVLATGVAVSGLGGGNEEVFGFVLEIEKLCYLAVGMAHVSGALAERINGAMPAGSWLDESDQDRTPTDSRTFWETFPNHADGAVLAFAAALVCSLLA